MEKGLLERERHLGQRPLGTRILRERGRVLRYSLWGWEPSRTRILGDGGMSAV